MTTVQVTGAVVGSAPQRRSTIRIVVPVRKKLPDGLIQHSTYSVPLPDYISFSEWYDLVEEEVSRLRHNKQWKDSPWIEISNKAKEKLGKLLIHLEKNPNDVAAGIAFHNKVNRYLSLHKARENKVSRSYTAPPKEVEKLPGWKLTTFPISQTGAALIHSIIGTREEAIKKAEKVHKELVGNTVLIGCKRMEPVTLTKPDTKSYYYNYGMWDY